jgi:hypothetical protein
MNQLKQIAQTEDFDMLYGMLADRSDVGRYLNNMVECVSADTGLHADDDIDRILDIVMEKLNETN